MDLKDLSWGRAQTIQVNVLFGTFQKRQLLHDGAKANGRGCGAALIFGERWACADGLIGVVVIIGPGTGSSSALSVLAVIGMLGYLASRAAPASLGTATLGLYGFLSVVLTLVSVWAGATYVRLPFGVALGVLVFGEPLSARISRLWALSSTCALRPSRNIPA